METPSNKEEVNFEDISFDDVVSERDTENLDTLGSIEEDRKVKPVEDEISIDEEVKEEVSNELDDDVSNKIVEDDSITEPTDKDDVDKEEIDEHFDKVEEEKEEESETPADKTVVKEVLESLGFEGEYDYEDTPQGLKTLTLDVANKLAEEQLDNILETFPLVQKHLEYVMNGGESQEFMRSNDPSGDYGSLELTEKDIPMQRVVLANYFKLKGHDNDMVKELLEDYEDSGKLFAKAELAKNALSKAQTKQRENLLLQQQSDNKTRHEEEQQFWTGIHKTIQDTNEFAGITIPNREKNKFFKYISAPINKQGHTQSIVDKSNATQEQKLLMDYLLFKGLNIKDIISTKAQSKSTRTLKDRIKKAGGKTLSSAKKRTKTKTSLDLNDLDFGSLMS